MGSKRQKTRGASGRVRVEALEGRRLLSATLTPTATGAAPQTAIAPPAPIFVGNAGASAVAGLSGAELTGGNTFYANCGIAFTGKVAIIPAPASTPDSVSIDWGDGSSAGAGTYTPLGDGTAAIAGSHTYANSGNYTVTISAVESANTVPVTIATGTANVIGAVAYTYFTDASSLTYDGGLASTSDYNSTAYTAGAGPYNLMTIPFPAEPPTIDWGDGQQSTGGTFSVEAPTPGNWLANFSGSHTYAAAGVYTVAVSETPPVGFGPNSTPVVFAQDTLYVSPSLALMPVGGTLFSGAVATVPVLTTAPTAVSIDWGDGSPPTTGQYGPESSGNVGDIVGSHTYPAATAGYVIKISAVEGSNSSPSLIAYSTARVIGPSNVYFVVNQQFSGMIASSIPNSSVVPTSISIDWGDGTDPSPGSYVLHGNGEFDIVTGSHTYSTVGTYTITVNAVVGSDSSPAPIAVSTANVTLPYVTDYSNGPTTPLFYYNADPILITSTPSYAPLADYVKQVGTYTAATTGTAGTSMYASWTTPKLSKLPAETPTVVIQWGDGTHSPATATVYSSNDDVGTSANHTYRKRGVYRAVARFMEGRKVIRRVVERLTILKGS